MKKLSDGLDPRPPAASEKKTGIVLANPDPDHPGLSSKAKVVYSKDKGRYLIATEEILPGELVRKLLRFFPLPFPLIALISEFAT